MKFRTCFLALTVVLALVASAHAADTPTAPVPATVPIPPPDTDPMPAAQARHFIPYTENETKGDLDLSATAAVFSKLKGRMALALAGTMPETRDFDTSEAAIYRVTNGDEFFQTNKGKAGPCPLPIRWVAVRALGSLTIRVTLLTIADWKAFKLDGPGRCGASTYQIPGAKSNNPKPMPGAASGKPNPASGAKTEKAKPSP